MEMTNEFFNNHGYLYISDIMAEATRLRFASIMLALKEENQLQYEAYNQDGSRSQFYANSFGGNYHEFEDELRKLQPYMEHILETKLQAKNSYARIYESGGVLNKHVDREGLDFTLSITLFSNIEKEWPLWCIDKRGNTVPINIGVGDGALMLGTTLTHWREKLECVPDQFVVQLFMHWGKLI
jgi:hypothetical protein